MPEKLGETEQQRSERGPFYATLKRIESQKEFFERSWKVQVRCTALFGSKAEETFLLMHTARREIEVSAGMLLRDPHPHVLTDDNKATWNEFRAAVWPAYGTLAKDGDKVGKQLLAFREGCAVL
jgi:hypothetical protein